MVPEQKRAWFCLAVFAAALVAFLVVSFFVSVRKSWGVLGLCGLSGFSPLLFRKKRKSGEVALDERDGIIRVRATMAAGLTSYVVVVLVCMIPWFIYMVRGEKTVAIEILPFVVFIGMIAHFLAGSIGILIGYGWGSRDGEE